MRDMARDKRFGVRRFIAAFVDILAFAMGTALSEKRSVTGIH